MRTVIGAEPGSMQWITRTLSPRRADTHSQIHAHGGWKATSERSVPWWPWILPFVFCHTAPSHRGSADFTWSHTYSKQYTVQIILSEAEKEGGGKIERRERKRMGILATHTISFSPSLHPLLASLVPSSPAFSPHASCFAYFQFFLLCLFNILPNILPFSWPPSKGLIHFTIVWW